MSRLVAYESSDEDDVGQDSVSVPPTSMLDEVQVPTEHPVSGNRDGPMLGPFMPINLEPDHPEPQGAGEEAASDPHLAHLSEHDLVRQLTQASHPMAVLPPSPPGSPNPAIEAKFKRFLELKGQGLHFNEDLAKKSSFRNPALFRTLMARAGLDEHGQYASSLPLSVWDPTTLPAFAYKEELGKSQQSIRDSEWAHTRNQAKSGTRTIDFHAAEALSTSSQQSSTKLRQKQSRP